MKWPLMLRRTHERAYTRQGQAYRRSIEEAQWNEQKARARLLEFAGQFANTTTTRLPSDGTLRILVDVEPRLLQRETPHALLELVCDRIMRQLVWGCRDPRGDLRQTEAQRALGL